MHTAFAVLVLLLADSADARHLLKADTSDPTPPRGGQVDAVADEPVPARFKKLATSDASAPSPLLVDQADPPTAAFRNDTRTLSEKHAQPFFFSVTSREGGKQQTRHIPAIRSYHKSGARRPRWVSSSSSPKKIASAAATKNRTDDARNLYVLGADDRIIYQDLSYPWGTVVKIYNTAGQEGSGVLIGPRHVLTASHVINWDNAWVTVEIGRYGDSVAATSTSRQIWAYTQVRGPTISSDLQDEDYAVITLNDDLGNRYGWMGSRTYDSSWDDSAFWWNIAYPGDRYTTDSSLSGYYPTYQGNKWLNEVALDYGPSREMSTDADIYPGSSGSPMFAWWADGVPYVVAVVSSEGDSQNWCAGGSWLTSLVNYVRTNDP